MAATDPRRSPSPHADESDRAVPTPEARQGVTHHNVRYVLAIGLGGVVLLFAVIYLLFFF